MIKPIETQYKGYRFRSRTEARWAVFFDTLGVKWEYEKEGYNLGALGWYLPDFWLPDFEMWVEIKGKEPTKEELRKGAALCEMTKNDVAFFVGAPWFNICRALYEYLENYSYDDDSGELIRSGIYEAHDTSDFQEDEDYDFEAADGNGMYYQGWKTWGLDYKDRPYLVTLVERDDQREALAAKYAYEAARAARFEHGEQVIAGAR